MQYLGDGAGKDDGGGGGEREDKKGRGQAEGWKYGGKIWDGGVKSVERLVVWGQVKIGDQGDVGGILGTGEKWTKKIIGDQG